MTRNPHEWSPQEGEMPPITPAPYLFSTAANFPPRVGGAGEEPVTQLVNALLQFPPSFCVVVPTTDAGNRRYLPPRVFTGPLGPLQGLRGQGFFHCTNGTWELVRLGC